ncbi:MAG: hypothetical protein IPL61_30095 [Myxococcales bacterium]|nr:hypothetical protein [Myxococcales bacterium]
MTAALAALAGTALAHPPPPPDDDPPRPARPDRPVAEWSTWIRVAYGTTTTTTSPTQRALGTPSPAAGPEGGWEAGVGADLTLPIGRGGDLRLGPWIEARTDGAIAIGGELMVAAVPAKLNLFFYDGEGVLIARAGTDGTRVTGAIAYGYRAPWGLRHPSRGDSRYMIGVRVVATATRAADDPHDWTASLGLETEPVGALRYLLGVRSWY